MWKDDTVMMRSLYTAATGMRAQQTNVDNISNNLSNVNTVGYKTQKAEFKSLLYQTIQTRTTTANGEQKPIAAQVGLGTRIASNTAIFTQGPLQASESMSDFAISGAGFFAVRGADGQTYYTRNGRFNWGLGPTGVTLAASDGSPVLDTNGNPIVLPAGITSENAVVTENGQIGYMNDEGLFVDLNQQFGIFQFNNPGGLEREAGSLYSVTDASGAPLNEANVDGLIQSKVVQGYLEGSNVQVADEMVNLIVAQRAYQLNSKAITTSDEMLEQANNLRR